ncbi:MAG: VWA domain-containing protein [Trueperaceae bacterium]|nr:VWA domain-containing protein [Trueperaceae bacterium]
MDALPWTVLATGFATLGSELNGLRFAHPWLLLAAVPLVLFVYLGRRRGWWLRALAMCACVIALAQPLLTAPGGHLGVLVDVSDSIGEAGLTVARALDLTGNLGDVRYTYVAAEAARVDGLGARVPATLRTDATDLARALQVAVANGATRVLLVSDGVTPTAPLLSALPQVPVDVLPVAPLEDVRVAELLLPERAAPGQRVEGTAVVRSDRRTSATMRVTVDRDTVVERAVELEVGESALTFSFGVPNAAAGAATVAVELLVPFDQPRSNDSAEAVVSIQNRPPVLVIDDAATAALLRLQGFDVVQAGPEALTLPLAYSAVVVRGSSGQFSQTQLALLAQYVKDGGGLLMTGGPDSFGFGAWYRTPVEDVLPVTTDLRTEVSLPLVALVMVIDRSQSMATGRPAKIDLAKDGAAQVVDLAYEQDLLGLIAFSDGPGTRWVFQLRQATERGKREMAAGIYSLDTGGGTVLAPAYRQALDALERVDASVKHVIILSDGQLYDQGPFGAEGTDFAAMASEALASGITSSTIAIGDAADFQRLAQIAAAGGGRYYAARDASNLPRIFTSEALTATRALLIDEPTTPSARPNPLYAFPTDLPDVGAYVATSLKSDAQPLLMGRSDEPLLATYRSGLGRSAALTTDLNGWAGRLGDWTELPGVVATVVRWLQARPGGMSATAERQGNSVNITLDAVRDGVYLNDLRAEARFGTAGTTLEQVAPGRYQGTVPWRGDAGADVVVAVGNELVARTRVTGPDPEYADVDGAALLAGVAQRTGGQVVDPETYRPALGSVRRSVWRWPVGAALALFMLELALRRVGPRAKRSDGQA